MFKKGTVDSIKNGNMNESGLKIPIISENPVWSSVLIGCAVGAGVGYLIGTQAEEGKLKRTLEQISELFSGKDRLLAKLIDMTETLTQFLEGLSSRINSEKRR